MEWTWLKDWWRLKKLRKRHQRHKQKMLSNGLTHTSAFHNNRLKIIDSDDNQNDVERNEHEKLEIRRSKCSSCQENDANNKDRYDYDETNDDDDDDIDADDFCYCDECLNVREQQ